MKKSTKAEIQAAGRKYLRAWLLGALRSGTIYYTIPHVARSGMSRRITLHRAKGGEVQRLFPSIADFDTAITGWTYSDALDVVAKDWGFNFAHQAYVIGGCGMDMVFAQIDHLRAIAGIRDLWTRSYNERTRRYTLTKCPKGTISDGRGRFLDYANAVQRASL